MRISKTLAYPVLAVGLALTGSSFFSHLAHAQDIGLSDLTPANGWTCNTTKTSCVNKNGAKASCPVFGGSSFTGQSTTIICTLTNPNGTGATNSTTFTPTIGGNVVTTSNVTTDAQGNVTSLSSKSSTPSGGVFDCVPVVGSFFGDKSTTDCLVDLVGATILTFANFLLGVAGVLFNLVMFYGVFQFANTIGNASGVLTAWGILRDLANMALLFGFIFMGIATILDTGAVQGFTAKNALPKLLIFAVLMNFSLFTCEAMIDVSNALASSMYTQSNTSACGSNDTKCVANYGLAGHIMQSTGLGGIWALTAKEKVNLGAVQYLGLALFATVGAIVFFAASIMLAIRVIVLTFLMIVSPIGFAGMAIPPLQKFAGDWWQRVIHQAFYAPIMLLLILISLKVSDSFTNGQYAGVNNALGGTIGNVVTDPNASTVSVVLVFMLIIGFMVASLIIANRFGAAGATAAVGFGKKVVLGSYGFVGGQLGRRTIGAGGNWAQKKYNASVASGRLKGLSGTIVDDAILGGLKKTQEARFGSSKSYKEKKEHGEARDKELAKIQRIENLKKYSKEGNVVEFRKLLKQLSDTEIIESDLLKGELTKENKLLADIATNTSPERFDKMMSSDKVSEKAKDMARELRFEGVNAAYTKVEETAAEYVKDPTKKAAYDDARKEMAKKTNELSDKDFGQFVQSTYSDILSQQEFAGSFSDDNFKDRRKNSNLTPAQQASFDAARNSALNNMDTVAEKVSTGMKLDDIAKLKDTALSDPRVLSAFASRIPKMSADDISKLPSQVVADPQVLNAMSGRQLVSLDPSKIDETHISAVVAHMEDILLKDPVKGAELQAHLLGNVKNKDKWRPYGI